MTIVASTVSFASVEFEVNTAAGARFENPGPAEFAIVTSPGPVAAYSPIVADHGPVMDGSWSVYVAGYAGSSTVSSQFAIVIDMGQSTPTTGQGPTFVVIGIGAYSGTTAPLSLP
ncbi:MAG: hypothetical protein ACREBZ_00385 [Thermoplasmata archaeon]